MERPAWHRAECVYSRTSLKQQCCLWGLRGTGKPCSEDNLGRTIWSRFSLFFSGFSSVSHERMERKCLFVVLKCNWKVTWIWFTSSNGQFNAFVAEMAACAASQASGELYNLYLHYYWSLPVASAHLDAPAIPLPSQYNRCWHRKFNLDILVMMKVVVIGLNWAWQECDIATVGHYSMSTTLNYTAGGTQPAACLPHGTEENDLFELLKEKKITFIFSQMKHQNHRHYKISTSVFASFSYLTTNHVHFF